VKQEIAKAGDTKYAQTTLSPTSVDYSGNVVSLFAALTRGDSSIQFDGRSINPKHVMLRYQWNGTTSVMNTVRTIVFQWHNSSVPTAALILASTGNATAPLQPTYVQNKNLFTVLHDSLDTINPQISTTVVGFTRKVFIPGSKLRKVYWQTGFNVVELNDIYLLVISDDAVTDYPDFSYAAEVAFTDG